MHVVIDNNVHNLRLEDWNQLRPAELEGRARAISESFSLTDVHSNGVAAIRKLIDSYIYATHPSSSENTSNEKDRKELENDIKRLKSLVRQFLNTELSWTSTGDPTVFGRRIAEAGLSSGQGVLLQIALSLFFQKGDANDLILMLDEPENHLHPAALIALIEAIQSACPHAQFWIATHSIHLIAHYGIPSLWFVKDGHIERAGKKAVEVLSSLLGGQEEIARLADFLDSPVHAASVQFAAQCLHAPDIVDTAAGDPQTRQIVETLGQLAKEHQPLRVLDYGAGRGRLLTELVSQSDAGRPLSDWCDYWAFERAHPESQQCKERIKEAYGDTARHIDSFHKLRSELNQGSVQVVVLCNVLHEIDPTEWLELLGEHGVATHLLHPDGYLLIVEDQRLKYGERAHSFGFLVLDSLELKALFGIDAEDKGYVCNNHPEPRYASRLKAHLIPSKWVRNATTTSRVAALKALKQHALEEAVAISTKSYDAELARTYAFWTHQHMNASLAVNRLSGRE